MLALDRRALTGDVLALLGALWISGYYVLAKMLRATKDLVPYVVVVYAATDRPPAFARTCKMNV